MLRARMPYYAPYVTVSYITVSPLGHTKIMVQSAAAVYGFIVFVPCLEGNILSSADVGG